MEPCPLNRRRQKKPPLKQLRSNDGRSL